MTEPPDPHAPYALKHPTEQQRRLGLLEAPHMQELTAYARRLKKEKGGDDVPWLDPCDGGTRARALFLMEAPGRKAVQSGFISRNNPDPTAKAICEDHLHVGLPREQTCLWNAVPWIPWNETRTGIRAPDREELEQARPWIEQLLPLFPHLRTVVLVGQKAATYHRLIRLHTDKPMVLLHHPSPRVYNKSGPRQENRRLLQRVVELIGADDTGETSRP